MADRSRFEILRVYDEAGRGGYRVLVDRLWSRGISKEQAALDEWAAVRRVRARPSPESASRWGR
jgi:uncharacterized protein YeaO (DUF488 family)